MVTKDSLRIPVGTRPIQLFLLNPDDMRISTIPGEKPDSTILTLKGEDHTKAPTITFLPYVNFHGAAQLKCPVTLYWYDPKTNRAQPIRKAEKCMFPPKDMYQEGDLLVYMPKRNRFMLVKGEDLLAAGTYIESITGGSNG